MSKVWITGRVGIVKADVLDRDGDFAITRSAEGLALTHLPTGVAMPHGIVEPTHMQLAKLLVELLDLPPFDLQSFEQHRPAIKAAFERAKGAM